MKRAPMEQLIVPATLDALKEIGAYVKAAADLAGLDSTKTYRLRMAVDEVAANIIIHGYGKAGLVGDIAVRGEVAGDSVTITLEDSGLAFDPRTKELPREEDLSLSVEERAIGGLGIFLVIRSVDEFNYEWDEQNKLNRNIFTMFRAEAV